MLLNPLDKVERLRRTRLQIEPDPGTDRVPPGQRVTNQFPVLHYGPTPRFDPATWDFRTFGLVVKPLQLTWEEFQKLPTQRQICDIHCVTHWSKLDTVWEGVPFRVIADLTHPTPEARFVIAHCELGFTTSLPLTTLMEDDVLLATRYADQPLELDHGYPLRLLVPRKYFWKSAKWLRALEFTDKDRLGFWEQAGYHNNADPWQEERFA